MCMCPFLSYSAFQPVCTPTIPACCNQHLSQTLLFYSLSLLENIVKGTKDPNHHIFKTTWQPPPGNSSSCFQWKLSIALKATWNGSLFISLYLFLSNTLIRNSAFLVNTCLLLVRIVRTSGPDSWHCVCQSAC